MNKFSATLKIGLVMVWFGLSSAAQVAKLEEQTTTLSRKLNGAVVPLFFWPTNFPPGPGDPSPGTNGAAFFVSDEGHFVTADHVLSPPFPGTISLHVFDEENKSSTLRYEVIERDADHDLALCKVSDFGAFRKFFPSVKFEKLMISSRTPQTGTLVLVSGFPLGSWKPTMQMGMIAATETVSPSVEGVPAGRRELLQIDVSGNNGNSGGPVVNLRTGEVEGIIIQFVPAPIHLPRGVRLPVPVAQNSGIMVAAPAAWLRALLERHGVLKKKK